MMHMHHLLYLSMAVFGQVNFQALNSAVNPQSMKKGPEPGHPWPIRLGGTCEVSKQWVLRGSVITKTWPLTHSSSTSKERITGLR